MKERVIRIQVGLATILVATCGIALIFLFGALPDFGVSTYGLMVKFPTAPGVHPNTPVQKSGVTIGRVHDVRLDDSGSVIMHLDIQDQYQIRQRETFRIRTGSIITGDALIDVVNLDEQGLLSKFDNNKDDLLSDDEIKEANQVLAEGTVVENGLVVDDPLQVLISMQENMANTFGSIQEAGGGIDQAADEFRQLMKNLNASFGDNEQGLKEAIEKTNNAMAEFERAMVSMNDLVGNEKTQANLKRASEQLPMVLADASATFSRARDTLDSLDRAGKLAENNLAHLERVTKPLGERGEQLVESITSSVEDFDNMVTQMNQLATAMNRKDGTLSRLIHDRELYDNFVRTSRNIEEASVKLRPILNDLRIFSDKIATDPRQLGVSGALQNRPVGSGFKPVPR